MEKSLEIKNILPLEFRDNGNTVVVSGDEKYLIGIAFEMFKKLDPQSRYSKDDLEEYLIKNKEELRLQGVYAMYFMENKLFVQNRNARNDESATEQLTKAAEEIVK